MVQGLNFVGRRNLGLVITSILLCSGCGKGSTEQQARELAQQLSPGESCDSIRNRFWTELYRQADVYLELPPPELVATDLQAAEHSREQVDIHRELAGVYSLIFESTQSLDDRAARIQRLAELELGDRTTPEKQRVQDELELKINQVEALIAESEQCRSAPNTQPTTTPTTSPSPTPSSTTAPTPTPSPTPTPTPTPAPTTVSPPTPVVGADAVPLFETFRTRNHAAVYGAYKTFAVAYQSCNAVAITALDWSNSDVRGINVIGTHPNGVGLKREVASASSVMSSNPYYSRRQGVRSGCFSQSSNPLIYDYGGKPYVSSATSTELDYFRNAGTGTTALGVDCSGYVSSALLVGGLRLRKNVSSKGAQTSGVNSAMFSKPEANGISCLKTVAVSQTDSIRPGDIIASSGHVIMVDTVGRDPLGIQSIQRASDCTTANLSTARLDFTIIQSAPVFGGMGLDRMHASEYLQENASMRQVVSAYAVAYCKARFGTVSTPSGLAASIVRHLGTSECMDPTRVTLAQESCLAECSANPTSRLLAWDEGL